FGHRQGHLRRSGGRSNYARSLSTSTVRECNGINGPLGEKIRETFFGEPLLSLPRSALLQPPHKKKDLRRFRLAGGTDRPEPGTKGEGPVPQASSRDQTR